MRLVTATDASFGTNSGTFCFTPCVIRAKCKAAQFIVLDSKILEKKVLKQLNLVLNI
jgi:hypothetical protein